jgi:hypothetical protein
VAELEGRRIVKFLGLRLDGLDEVFARTQAPPRLWGERQGVAVEPAEQQGLRLAVLVIILFLVVGLAVALTVDEKKAREAARAKDPDPVLPGDLPDPTAVPPLGPVS